MRYTFTTSNPEEANRIMKANDMAQFIWELMSNGWRKYKHDESFDYQPIWEDFSDQLDDLDINPDNIYS